MASFPILIGWHGKMKSGKDTAADFAIQWAIEHNMVAVKRGFAWKLKLSAYRCFKPDATVEEALVWADWLKTQGEVGYSDYLDKPTSQGYQQRHVTGREFLQYYGTEAHRGVFDSDFWVDALLPKFGWGEEFRPATGPIPHICMVSDVRFDNEAERVRELGGVVVEVQRGENKHRDQHASEAGIDPALVDYVLDNNGTLLDLSEGVSTLLEELV